MLLALRVFYLCRKVAGWKKLAGYLPEKVLKKLFAGFIMVLHRLKPAIIWIKTEVGIYGDI
jgi:hypothetical protein